jgi:hypothetical protein
MKRILCIGKDATLLWTRCAVLQHSGYDARGVIYESGEDVLTREQFDLIILSAILNDQERERICELVDGAVPILSLQKVLFARELLGKVEQCLGTFQWSMRVAARDVHLKAEDNCIRQPQMQSIR